MASVSLTDSSVRVFYHGIFARAGDAGADLLAALVLGPLEVRTLHVVRVADGLVSTWAAVRTAGYRF